MAHKEDNADRPFGTLITSIGGVGSSFFIKFFNEQGLDTNTNKFKTGTSPYKHAMTPPERTCIKRAIFMYGNPYNAVLSIEKRNLQIKHMINKKIDCEKLSKSKEEKYKIKKPLTEWTEDPYEIKDQLDNWMNAKTNYPIMFLKYEEIWNNLDSIFDFLDVEKSKIKKFPKNKKRKSDWKSEDEKVKEALQRVYSGVYETMESMDGCFIKGE